MSIKSPSAKPENGFSSKAKSALFVLGVVAAGVVVKRTCQEDENFALYGKEGCLSKIIVNPENVKLKECNDESEKAEVVGPTAIMFRNQIVQVLQGEVDLTLYLRETEKDGDILSPGSVEADGKALISIKSPRTKEEMIENIKTIQGGQWIGSKEELDRMNQMWDDYHNQKNLP